MGGVDVSQLISDSQNLFGVQSDVRCLARCSSGWLYRILNELESVRMMDDELGVCVRTNGGLGSRGAKQTGERGHMSPRSKYVFGGSQGRHSVDSRLTMYHHRTMFQRIPMTPFSTSQ